MMLSGSALPSAARASGGIGFFGIVERVVFEPSQTDAERIQVWGAFAYVDPQGPSGPLASRAERGYLYFRVRSDISGFTSAKEVELNRREWADLMAVAGTGQAIGFGSWGYIGSFTVLDPKGIAGPPSYLWERKPSGGARADLRVRPANEPPANPATYQTDTGIVKLDPNGSHAAVVARLREALKPR
jgi:hypothetical protein